MEDASKQQRREDARTAPPCDLVFRHPACEVEISYRVRRVVDPCGSDTLPDPCEPKGFVEPSAQESDSQTQVLTARIFLRNTEVTSTCAEGLRDNPAYAATVADGAFETSVRLSDLPSTTSSQVALWTSMSQEYLDAAAAESEVSLVSYLTLTPAQAGVLYQLLQAAQAAVDAAAADLADQARVCEAWNDAVNVRCPEDMWPHPLVDSWFLFADGSAVGSMLANEATGTTDLIHNANNTGPAVIPYTGDSAGIIGGRFIPRTTVDDVSVPSAFDIAFLLTTQGNPDATVLKPTGTGVMVTSLPGSTSEDRTMGHYATLLREASSKKWKLVYRNASSGVPTIEDLGAVLMDGLVFPAVWIGVVVGEGGLLQFRKKEIDDSDWVNMGSSVNVGVSVQYAGLYGFTGDYAFAIGHGFADASSSLSDIYAPFVSVAEGAHIAYEGEGEKTAKEVANENAMRTALSQLGCHFGNDETSAYCPAGVGEPSAWDPETAEFLDERPDPTRALNTGPYADSQTVARDALQLDLDLDTWLADEDPGEGVTKEATNLLAEEAALSLLVAAGCFYGNIAIDETCVDRLTEEQPPDPGPDWPEGSIGGSSFNSGNVPGVYIAADAVVSSVSGPDADELAQQAADAEARCFWRSAGATVGCPDTVLAYDQDTESWTEDEDGNFTFTALSGSVTYPQGAFISMVSLEDANTQRDESGALEAVCVYGNKTVGSRCLSKAAEYSSAVPENFIRRQSALAAASEAQSLSQQPSAARGNIPGSDAVTPEIQPANGQTCTQGSRPVLAACVDPEDISRLYPEEDRHFLGTSTRGLLSNSVVVFPRGAVSDTYANGDKNAVNEDAMEDELTETALLQAKASRSCQYASPALRVHCGVSSIVTQAMVDAVEDVVDEVTLPADESFATMFNRDSRGSKVNPVLMPSGSVISEASFLDAYQKAVFEAASLTECFWKSPKIEVECGQWDSTDLEGVSVVSEIVPKDGGAFDSASHVVRVSTGKETEPPDRTAVVTDWTGNLTDAAYGALQSAFFGVGILEDVFGEPGNLNVDKLADGTTRTRLTVLPAGALSMQAGQLESYDALVSLAIRQAKSQAVCSYTHTSAVWWCGANPENLSPAAKAFRGRVRPQRQLTIVTNPVTEGTFVSTVSQLNAQKSANRELQSRWEQTFNDSAYGCTGGFKITIAGCNTLCVKETKGIGVKPVPLALDCPRPPTLTDASDDTMASVRAFQKWAPVTEYQKLGLTPF